MVQYIKQSFKVYKYNLKELLIFTALGITFSSLSSTLFFPIPAFERLITSFANSTNRITFLEIINLLLHYIIRIFVLPVFWTLPIVVLTISAFKAQEINIFKIKEIILNHYKAFIAIIAFEEIISIAFSAICCGIDALMKFSRSIQSDGLYMICLSLYIILTVAIFFFFAKYYVILNFVPLIVVKKNLGLKVAIDKSLDFLERNGNRVVFQSLWSTVLLIIPVFIVLSPLNFISFFVYTATVGITMNFIIPLQISVDYQIYMESN